MAICITRYGHHNPPNRLTWKYIHYHKCNEQPYSLKIEKHSMDSTKLSF
jgi:hypothetical protein